jgi:hypothetical protein
MELFTFKASVSEANAGLVFIGWREAWTNGQSIVLVELRMMMVRGCCLVTHAMCGSTLDVLVLVILIRCQSDMYVNLVNFSTSLRGLGQFIIMALTKDARLAQMPLAL